MKEQPTIELPLKAFYLTGCNGNDKIEITINEIFDHGSLNGGRDFRGELAICAGSFRVNFGDFYSSTGMLTSFLTSLSSCYNFLEGKAEYKDIYDDHLHFVLEMEKTGRAVVDGCFHEVHHLPGKLYFQFETDQTCILDTISALKRIDKLFG